MEQPPSLQINLQTNLRINKKKMNAIMYNENKVPIPINIIQESIHKNSHNIVTLKCVNDG
jgi:hypothetical protein